MVSGKPYISTNSATMNAVKALKLRQSRALAGLKKLKANMTNTAMFTTTSSQRPYAGPVCSMMPNSCESFHPAEGTPSPHGLHVRHVRRA